MPISQTIAFSCSPAKVYETITSSDAFAEATGAPASIDREEGAAFSCFGGQITGRNIELQDGERIVQAWRAGPWPDGVYSIVKMDIAAEGNGAALVLHHDGYPDGMEEHLAGGWQKMYWDPLRAYLG